MSRLWKSKLLWGSLVLGAIIWVVASRGSPKNQSVRLGTVTRGDLAQRVTIAGSVFPNRKTIISAPYNGYVRKLYVQTGDRVHAGDPVVSLAQSLRGSGEEVYPLRAPIDGIVVQVLRTEGEYVEQQGSQGGGNSILRIDDLARTFVEANSPEIEVSKLKVGQEAVVKASAVLSRSYHGKINHISLAAKEQKDWDRSRVEFPLSIEIKDNDGQLKPGMSVVVDVQTSKESGVLMLKHEFIQQDGTKYFAVTESGERRDIEVGLRNDEAFEIKSGLKEGEKVRQTDFLSVLKAK
jgi:multidrug efflux pump subunit AcrA (membrane-fusion protein)